MSSIHAAGDYRPVGSYPPTGIDVLIVGAGFAGLTASIECIRKGHNVRLLERMGDIDTAGVYQSFKLICQLSPDLWVPGDMYFMGHSATRFFQHWPEMLREYEDISMGNAWLETFKHSGERIIPPMKVSDRLRPEGMDPNTSPGTFQMRPLIYKMLLHQTERLGVNVQFGKKVVDYSEDVMSERAVAITDQGERFEADVVIAADGVGSKSQKLVGGQVRAKSSGRAIWRASFSSEHLDKHPEVKAFFGNIPGNNNDEPVIRKFLG